VSRICNCRDKVVLTRSTGLDIFGAHFQDFFEIAAYVCESALQHYNDVFIVLALLVYASLRVRDFVDGGQGTDLLVQRSQVLLDDISEFSDFYGLVVEEGFAAGELAQTLEFADGGCDAPAYVGGFARKLAALFAGGLGGGLGIVGEEMLSALGCVCVGESFLLLEEDGAELGGAVLD
jgi:hypothetical protein